MRYNVVYDRPGRTRIRCGALAFTAEEGYGIAEKLRKEAGAERVEVCPSTGVFLYAIPKITGRPFSPFLTA